MVTNYTAFETIDETISVTRQDTTAEITVLAPYNVAIAFAQTQVGGIKTVLGTPTYYIGAAYARIAGLFCSEAKITPFGDYTDTSPYDFKTAKLTLKFGRPDSPEQDTDSVEVADLSYAVSGQELVLPKTQFYTGSAHGTPLGDDSPNPVKVVPAMELTASFKNRPQLDPSTWQDYVGKINDDDFYGHDEGTVMFVSASTRRGISSDGSEVWSHDYKFSVKPNGWNYIWKPDDGSGDQGEWVELFPHQYEEADLMQLWPELAGA